MFQSTLPEIKLYVLLWSSFVIAEKGGFRHMPHEQFVKELVDDASFQINRHKIQYCAPTTIVDPGASKGWKGCRKEYSKMMETAEEDLPIKDHALGTNTVRIFCKLSQ